MTTTPDDYDHIIIPSIPADRHPRLLYGGSWADPSRAIAGNYVWPPSANDPVATILRPDLRWTDNPMDPDPSTMHIDEAIPSLLHALAHNRRVHARILAARAGADTRRAQG